MPCTHPHFTPAPTGYLHHPGGERLARHCHAQPFAAVVLRGRYVEAGDQGRREVSAGDVLIHGAFESHLDRFASEGADVIVLPLPAHAQLQAFGKHQDPDTIARALEHDAVLATEILLSGFLQVRTAHQDWPDMLAAALRADPSLSLAVWSRDLGLRPETISRGFRAAYGVTPAAYRATARSRAAFRGIQQSTQPLVDIAFAQGFADQAHMTRAIVTLTGRAPSYWRTPQQRLAHEDALPLAHRVA